LQKTQKDAKDYEEKNYQQCGSSLLCRGFAWLGGNFAAQSILKHL
jgi:hypothetical protein